MRLILVCNEFPPGSHGGIGSAAFDLANELAKQKVDFEVVGIYPPLKIETFALPPQSGQYGYPVSYLRSYAHRFPLSVRILLERWQLRNWLNRRYREAPFDLVFSEDFDGCLAFGTPGKSRSIIRLNGSNFVYDDLMRRPGIRLIWWCEQRTLKLARHWIGVSQFFLKETCRRFPPLSGIETTVIPNPVDTDLFSPPSGPDQSVPGRIVYHNTLHRRKGIYDLFGALPRVFREIPEAHLELYGGKSDLPKMKAELLSLIPEEFHSRVVFHGRVDRYSTLPGALASARVACYPSHLETFGIAPVEAMAMKRVTIYSDSGPGREIIEHGVEGFLCPPRDPDRLAELLIQTLQMDEMTRTTIGEAARRKAVSAFGRATVTARYLDLFQKATQAN